MEHHYWLDRWINGEIAFHQDEINPYLIRYWQTASLDPTSAVFVPLCGKSRDMAWLQAQGHSVLGVELSSVAIQAFFRENGETPQQINTDRFIEYRNNNTSILCGDFFDINKVALANIRAVFDRAALIALPTTVRQHYVQHLLAIVPSGTKILLVTIDYPQDEMTGPPFAVSPEEVKHLYQSQAGINLLSQQDILAEHARFRERGISQLQEYVFLCTVR